MSEQDQNGGGGFQNALKTLGLHTKEANVYVALLMIGSGTVSEVAKKAEINRTTGYDILSSLCAKGLVSISGKEPKQEYRCENPDKLLSFLKKDIEKNKKIFVTQRFFYQSLNQFTN